MTEEIYQLVGENSGPRSIVLAGVHGDETCGVDVISTLLPALTIDRGVVWFGYGNPRALKAHTRYTERDLNRMFMPDSRLSAEDKESYEYQRAQYLKTYLEQAGALLDIHAHPGKEQQTFAICEPGAVDIVRFLPTTRLVSGFDAVEPGGADYYMNSTGKVGICFECGYLDDEYSRQKAQEATVAFLKARGHIKNDIALQAQEHIRIFQKIRSKTNNFQLLRPFANFERLSQGEAIGIDGGTTIVAPQECRIVFARDGHFEGDEIFLLGEVLEK